MGMLGLIRSRSYIFVVKLIPLLSNQFKHLIGHVGFIALSTALLYCVNVMSLFP
jgi:hypothetical protein